MLFFLFEGAIFGDRQSWYQTLFRVFSNLIDSTIQNHVRANRTKVVKNPKIRDDLVELAALVGR